MACSGCVAGSGDCAGPAITNMANNLIRLVFQHLIRQSAPASFQSEMHNLYSLYVPFTIETISFEFMKKLY